MKYTKIRVYRQILKLIILAILGLIATITIPAISAQSLSGISQTIPQPANGQQLLQKGIEVYEAEHFSEAAEIWQKAADTFASQGDPLHQALALSNLSLTYQHLGKWEEAETAINQSLNLLQQLNNITNTQTYSEILAKAFNTQGRLQWEKGQLEEALKTWKKAGNYYEKANNNPGWINSLINQAKAMQALGISTQSQIILQKVAENLEKQSDSAVKARGFLNLGIAYRQVGKLNESKDILQISLDVAEKLALSSAKNHAWLELGNTERALANRAIAIGKKDEDETHNKEATTYYQNIIQSNSLSLRLQAKLNQLSLLIEIGKLSETDKLWQEIQNDIALLPPSRTAIYSQLNFARSLTCLKNGIDTEGLSCTSRIRQEKRKENLGKLSITSDSLTWEAIAKIIATALQEAQELKDPTTESYALGQLGGLYEITGQFSEAEKLTLNAINLAKNIQASHIIYRWDWQLGRLLEKQQNIKSAIAAYREAVKALKSVRSDLVTINSDVQFSFRDEVEPFHRQLVDLLLRSEGNTEPSQENLKEAIEQIDNLQLAELQNFLGCNPENLVKIDEISESITDPKAAIVYPIILENKIAIILQLPEQTLRYYETIISRTVVEKTLEKLQTSLANPEEEPDVIEQSQEIYSWLIKPLIPDLEKNKQIETLVFVPDGLLRNIPLGILYDEDREQYLLQNYAVAIAPRLQIFVPKQTPQNLNVLTGGVGIEQDNFPFPPIYELEAELKTISEITKSNPPILNEDFTKENLHKQLDSGNFSAIHIKSHGKFSSDPEETFIVAYKAKINSKDLADLIQLGGKEKTKPLELLVLSACETAQGDNRAVLGLTGIAVRLGSRSAISSLWTAQDERNTELMTQFYTELLTSGITKVKALQMVQLSLLKQGYSPYIWANYILVGNWL